MAENGNKTKDLDALRKRVGASLVVAIWLDGVGYSVDPDVAPEKAMKMLEDDLGRIRRGLARMWSERHAALDEPGAMG